MQLKFFLFCALILVPVSFAGAKTSSENSTKRWQPRIQAACVKTYIAKTGIKKDVCACIAKNFLKLAEKEPTKARTEGLLGFVEGYYGKTLPLSEIDKDPFEIDEFVIPISKGCLDSPAFDYQKI